jgi:hypothetical protein
MHPMRSANTALVASHTLFHFRAWALARWRTGDALVGRMSQLNKNIFEVVYCE